MARPMKPPRSAPAIPNSMVTMKPPGSRPGVTSFAIIPTTNPKTIHEIIPMPSILLAEVETARRVRGWHLEEVACEHAFVSQQPLLTVEPAAVSGQAPVAADDAVAGDDDGHGVGPVGRPDRSHRRGFADPLRQFRIRDGGAARDAAQRRPHGLLERRAVQFDSDGLDRGRVAGEVAVENRAERRQRFAVARLAGV